MNPVAPLRKKRKELSHSHTYGYQYSAVVPGIQQQAEAVPGILQQAQQQKHSFAPEASRAVRTPHKPASTCQVLGAGPRLARVKFGFESDVAWRAGGRQGHILSYETHKKKVKSNKKMHHDVFSLP